MVEHNRLFEGLCRCETWLEVRRSFVMGQGYAGARYLDKYIDCVRT
jgi:hypothetical protein